MKVSVFGVGYVGCVTAACMARSGHQVIGVDVDPFKVSRINQGRAPFFEPGLNELIAQMVSAGRLQATTDQHSAVRDSEVAFVCVGTPAGANGSIRLDYLLHVFETIGKQLAGRKQPFVIALRSTVLPRAIDELLIPILERCSGKVVGKELGFVYNPEFLREGTALSDFDDPPWSIIGAHDQKAGDIVASLYTQLSAPVIRTDPKTAVLLKYFSNAFHAMKVAFANEVSSFCRDAGIDSRKMMEIFCKDTKLNISPRYLSPGFAFGGSCLPKDLKALMSEAGQRGLPAPLLGSIMESNEIHLRNCIQMVFDTGRQRVGLVGLAFKEGTDDLRESPAVELAERLIGKGFDVRIFEPSLAQTELHGANLAFIQRSIPHLRKLAVDSIEELFGCSEVVVVMQKIGSEERKKFRTLKSGQICLDLAGTLSAKETGGKYVTIDSPGVEAPMSAPESVVAAG